MLAIPTPLAPLWRRHARRLGRVGLWGALGLVALALEIGAIALLHDALRLPLPPASALAGEAAVLARFALNDRWVFGHRRPTLARLARYHGACAGAFVVSWLVLNGTALFLGVPYALATLLGSAASAAWGLPTNFLWDWRQRPAG